MKVTDLVKKYKRLLPVKQRKRLIALFFVVLISAVLEMFGVSVMIPFVGVVMGGDVLAGEGTIARILAMLGFQDQRTLILSFILLMIVIFVFKDLFIIFQQKLQADYIYTSRLETQARMMHAYLCKPYEFFLSAQSGEVLRVIHGDVQEVYTLLLTMLTFVSDTIISVALITLIAVIEPLMTLMVIGLLALMVALIVGKIKPILEKEGQELRKNRTISNRWVQQAFHGIKEVKVAGNEAFFEKNFCAAGDKQNHSEKTATILNAIPRLLLEMGAVSAVLAAIAIMVVSGREIQDLMAILGAFAMASVKLLPTAGRIVYSLSRIAYQGPAIDNLIRCLDEMEQMEAVKEEDTGELVTFEKEIDFQNISYVYPNSGEVVFENAHMTIPAGEFVGIIGTSGAGKTTAVDILLGLLSPKEGKILVDGIDVSKEKAGWLRQIGYIPQNIYLMNDSIGKNVAFGREYDEKRIWKALEEAHLADFVRTLPDGLETRSGEMGIRFSGGQRQRIGIARALYMDPGLLIFDEATSALDQETENAIMESIHALQGKKTMIIIAHRLKTIERCDRVYRVEDKKIWPTDENLEAIKK